jgi:hypothetical protein
MSIVPGIEKSRVRNDVDLTVVTAFSVTPFAIAGLTDPIAGF